MSTDLLLLGVGFFVFDQGADVVHQVPGLFGLDTRAFGRHVVVTILNDVEQIAVLRSFSVSALVKSIIESFISTAVSPLPSPVLPWHISQSRVHHFLARAGMGEDFTGFCCFEASTGMAA